MSKQTAVEWLHQKLATSSQEEIVGNINIWFAEAKAMFEEQMRVTYNQGLMSNFQNFEEYYIQTYKGGEQ